jgi:predicted phage terminase large subunit-like protein
MLFHLAPFGDAGPKADFDLFMFAKKVLGYTLLQECPHREWAKELDRRHRNSLWLEPRYTYKSTIFTKAYPIWRLLEDTNLRILLVNATAENAEAFLSEIVGHFLRNKRLLQLWHARYGTFPLDARTAKTKSITLNTRTANFSEPSISTIGALGNLVSAHYDLAIVDDLCNELDRESQSIREKKKRWFQDLPSVLSPTGQLVLAGTHWHFDDVYSYIKNELNPQLSEGEKYYIQSESCYLDDGRTPRFPKLLSAELLKTLRIKKGVLLFAAQYENKPITSEAQKFKLEAMHTIVKEEIDVDMAEAYGFCDPGLGVTDFSAIVTILKYKNAWTVFHADLSLAADSELIDLIVAHHAFFHYKSFGIEANSLGKAKRDKGFCNFELVLQARQAEKKVVVPYKLVWHTAPKLNRISSLEPFYSNGQLQFLSSWNQDYPELIKQLIQFPLADHDDGPDALAGCVQLMQDEEQTGNVLIPRAR